MIRYKIHKKRIEQLSQQKASKIDRQKCIECTRNRTLKKKLKACEACKFNSWSFGTVLKEILIKTKLIFVLFVNNDLFF